MNRWVPWLGVFMTALLVRVAYWSLILPGWTPRGDDLQYWLLSGSLADGQGFGLVFPQLDHHPTAFRPPLFPFLLVPGRLLFGDALWPGRLLNSLIGSGVVVLSGIAAYRIAGERAAKVTVCTVMLYPPLLANDTITLTEPLALLLMLAALLLLDDGRYVWSGMSAGFLLLTRPNAYLVVIILGVWAMRRLGGRRALGLVAVSLLVIAPWSVRNLIQVGTPNLTTSGGFTLAAIYAEPAQKAGHFVDPVYASDYNDWKYRLAQFDEAEWDALLTRTAMNDLADNPSYVLVHLQRTLRGYFEISPGLNHYPEVNDGRHMGVRRWSRPIFFLVSVGGLIGISRALKDRRLLILTVVTAQFVVLSLLTVAPPRLRAPFDLLCCIGFGVLLGGIKAHGRLVRGSTELVSSG